MLKEFLELIQSTERRALTPTILCDLSPDGRKAFVAIDGAVTQYNLPPRCRSHTVHSLADLIAYANQTAAEADEPAQQVAWHDTGDVTLILDDADRRDMVEFPLTLSARFLTLQQLRDKKPAFDQAKFVRLLRVELGMDNLSVVSRFRKIDFAAGDVGQSSVEHGNVRLGKDITSRVTGISDLPEELTVEVPVYQQAGERDLYRVQCAVEIDTVNRVFQLIPLPDEIERALDAAQASIHSRLREGLDSIPIYYGCP